MIGCYASEDRDSEAGGSSGLLTTNTLPQLFPKLPAETVFLPYLLSTVSLAASSPYSKTNTYLSRTLGCLNSLPRVVFFLLFCGARTSLGQILDWLGE